MSMPTPRQLHKTIVEEQKHIERLEKARARFLSEWNRLEKEQAEIVQSLRQYMEKVKMREVLKTIHSIKE